MIPSKLLLFGVPLLLTLGTGIGVAYHDGVMADDVKEIRNADEGDSVTVRGRVIATDAACTPGDTKLKKDVGCMVLRDLNEKNSFILVSTTGALPEDDKVVVVRGILKFHYKMDGGSGSTSWKGGCWDAGANGSGCYDGSAASWSWPGLEVAWVDASSVAEPWIFG